METAGFVAFVDIGTLKFESDHFCKKEKNLMLLIFSYSFPILQDLTLSHRYWTISIEPKADAQLHSV